VKVGRWQTHIQSMELGTIRYKDFFSGNYEEFR
jgi:hypothetical protein